MRGQQFTANRNSAKRSVMTTDPEYEVKPGDRLRLSEAGRRRNPRLRTDVCTVIQVGSERRGRDVLLVRLDGNAAITPMHRSYLEPMRDEDGSN